MKKLSILTILIIAFSSCEDNTKIRPSLTSKGTMKFSSIDHISSLTNKIPEMTKEELDSWEKENSFISYRSIINEANKEWELVSSEDEKTSFLEKYGDILTINDGLLIPSISILMYQSIVNREGIYETDGYLNKVIGDFIVSAKKEDYRKIVDVNSEFLIDVKGIENSGLKMTRLTGMESNSDARTNGTCSTIMEATYFDNHSKCRDDREVYLEVKSYLTYWTNSEGEWRQPRVSIGVAGRYRNYWCNWFSYDTQLEYRSVSFSIIAWTNQNYVGVPTLFTRTPSNKSTTIDHSSLIWDQPIGDPLLNQYVTPSAFTSLHAEASSRGVGYNWAIIDCQ
jgi:hypothetical protein